MLMDPESAVQSKVRKRKTNIVESRKYMEYVEFHKYVDSRKPVQMNLSAGQEWRHPGREEMCGHW